MTQYKHKDEILRLRAEGKTYNEIQAELGCSKGTIAYHCGAGQKEKVRARQKRMLHGQIKKNLWSWQNQEEYVPKTPKGFNRSWETRIKDKVRKFHDGQGKAVETKNFSYDDVLAKIEGQEWCYLTGRPIDKHDSSTFHFDHIVPRSKGGTNTLDNLGIASRDANFSKNDMTLEEFLILCADVLIHWEVITEEDLK